MTEQEKQKQIEEITNIIGKYDGTEKQDDVIYSQVAYLSIEEIAQTLINAGYGDTKQAVRDFAEKVKREFIEFDSTFPDEDCAGFKAGYNVACKSHKGEIDNLVKEICDK